MKPMYSPVDRAPQEGDLVQCIFTGEVWYPCFVCGNREIIVGEIMEEDGGIAAVTLEFGDYIVLGKTEPAPEF